jgi:hypothetical protein
MPSLSPIAGVEGRRQLRTAATIRRKISVTVSRMCGSLYAPAVITTARSSSGTTKSR